MTGIPESTSSMEMAKSRQSTELIQLGQRICKELELDDSCDTLSKWLAHLLGEKIQTAAAESDPQKKAVLENQAIEIILKLWKKRYFLPNRVRPFARLEDAINALANLGQRRNHGLDHWLSRSPGTEISPWKSLADAIDDLHKKIGPLVVLIPIVEEMNGDPRAWERANKSLLAKVELDAMELFDDRLGLAGQDQLVVDSEQVLPTTGKQRVALALEQIESVVAKVAKALTALKAINGNGQ